MNPEYVKSLEDELSRLKTQFCVCFKALDALVQEVRVCSAKSREVPSLPMAQMKVEELRYPYVRIKENGV